MKIIVSEVDITIIVIVIFYANGTAFRNLWFYFSNFTEPSINCVLLTFSLEV